MTGTEILVTILGGVSLLLWGVRMVRTGVMRAFGSALMSFMGRWVGNRYHAAAVGAAVGTALQSSTATALLISPLVAQRAILTSGALAVMLGADLGSAIAALVFSSGISVVWPLFSFFGYVIHAGFGERSTRLKNIGRILIGFGLLFLGLRIISGAAAELSSSPLVLAIMETAANEPILLLLLGVLLTWLSYSSIAVILFAAALTSVSGISAEHLFPLVLGVNLGAALPALSSTFSEAPATRRIPFGNLLFRSVGVAMAVVFLTPISSFFGGLDVAEPTRIVLLHLCFNAALIPVFIGFVGPVGVLLGKWLPDMVGRTRNMGPRFLNESLLETPPAALAAAARETLRMGEIIEDMLAKTILMLKGGGPEMVAEMEEAEDQLDALNEAIKMYLTRLMGDELSDDDSRRAVDIVIYTTNLEHVGDIIDRNLVELANKMKRLKAQFSVHGMKDIEKMHARVMDTLDLSLNVFMTSHPGSARDLVLRKTELRGLEIEGTERHIERLRAGHFESVLTTSIHLDVTRDFKRINSHLASVAYPVLERSGQLRKSRLTKKALRR
jgi:phosphate:Na+ symporter